MLVLSNPTAGEDAEYNRWYDTEHLPDMEQIPGVVRGERFKLTPPHGSWRYAAIYELDAENPEDVIAETRRRSGTERLRPSSAIDKSTMMVSIMDPILRR